MVIGENLIDMKSTGEEFKKPFLFIFLVVFFFFVGINDFGLFKVCVGDRNSVYFVHGVSDVETDS